jgi:TRAP-type uncharacterized transport system substrate-binding protein
MAVTRIAPASPHFLDLEPVAFSCPERTFSMRLTAAMYWLGLLHASALGMLVGAPIVGPAAAQVPQPPQQPPAPLAAVPTPQPAPAPAPVAPAALGPRAKLNQETLIVAASRPGTTYLAMANDLMVAVGDGGRVRILPVAGDGGRANLQDALLLRGIDMAIVPANVLADAKARNAFGGALTQRLAYLTLLYSEEVHVIAGAGVNAIGDLAGKRVAVPAEDGTAQFTAGDIFQRLGLAVEAVPMTPADALEKVRTGGVAAAVLVGGKPLGLVAGLPKDGSVRLLSLPFAVLPEDAYAPAVLLPEDYPALVPPGAIVETVAVSAVLIAGRGEDSHRRVTRHTPAVLEAIARLAISKRHPKWKDVNLGAVLPGWLRAESAEAWLRRAAAQRKAALQEPAEPPPRPSVRVKSSDLGAARRKKLLAEFDDWARKSAVVEEAAAK